MHLFKLVYLLLLGALLTQCGTEADPEPSPPESPELEIDLDTVEVFTLESTDEYLYAGTKYGVHRNGLTKEEKVWTYLGPEIAPDSSRIGDILNTGAEIFVVARNTIELHDLPENYISIYKSKNLGENWTPIEIKLEGRERPYILNRIAKPANSAILYGDWHFIFKSTDVEEWKNISTEAIIGSSEFLTISKNYPDQIWTGGWMETFVPYLAKSEDGGKTWTNLNEEIYFGEDATVYDAVVHPKDSQKVLVGVGAIQQAGNVIRKSEDGGQTWHTVLRGYNIRTMCNSQAKAGRVYASGMSPQEQLFVAVSDDFGDSWDIEIVDEKVNGIITNELTVAEVDEEEVIYLATTRGVHSYQYP